MEIKSRDGKSREYDGDGKLLKIDGLAVYGGTEAAPDAPEDKAEIKTPEMPEKKKGGMKHGNA